jgi:serine/threonine-protein kinase
VFAAGVLLWEILTYRRLTQDRTQTEIVQGRIGGAESELMLQKGTDVPAELMEICSKAASKAPEDRYPSAGAMQAAIRDYIARHSLEFPSEKLRDLLHRTFEQERKEMRSTIDRRMKQAQLEDEHPSEVSKAPFVPNAGAVFGGTSSGATPTNAPTPVGRGKLFAAAAVVALVAGTAGALVMNPGAKSAPSQVAPSTKAVSGAAPNTAPPTQALVHLELSASPASAELLLDGAKLEGNPFKGQLPRDGALHRLEARAAGRKSEARMLPLDRDMTLHLDLATLPAPASTAAGSGAKSPPSREGTPPPSAPANDFVHKSRDNKPARPIDNSDPYGP